MGVGGPRGDDQPVHLLQGQAGAGRDRKQSPGEFGVPGESQPEVSEAGFSVVLIEEAAAIHRHNGESGRHGLGRPGPGGGRGGGGDRRPDLHSSRSTAACPRSRRRCVRHGGCWSAATGVDTGVAGPSGVVGPGTGARPYPRVIRLVASAFTDVLAGGRPARPAQRSRSSPQAMPEIISSDQTTSSFGISPPSLQQVDQGVRTQGMAHPAHASDRQDALHEPRTAGRGPWGSTAPSRRPGCEARAVHASRRHASHPAPPAFEQPVVPVAEVTQEDRLVGLAPPDRLQVGPESSTAILGASSPQRYSIRDHDWAMNWDSRAWSSWTVSSSTA